jgi:hypothetical protein
VSGAFSTVLEKPKERLILLIEFWVMN